MAAHLPDVIDEDILCCPLCLRELQQPKVLPCLHLFCRSCLQHYVEKYKSRPRHNGSVSRREWEDEYLTFPDTPDADKTDRFQFGRQPKRLSEASDDSTPQKRFQQPERYTDRDSLVYRAALYRDKYRQSLTKVTGRKTPTKDIQRDTSNKPLPSPKPKLSMSFNDAKTTQNDQLDSTKDAQPKKNVFSRTLSSPQRLIKTAHEEELQPMSGRVSNMVDIFERRNSHSSSSRENTPPLAMFRPRTKGVSEPELTSTFVPLCQRPVPVLEMKPGKPKTFTKSTSSFDMSPRLKNTSVLPRSVSLSTQESYDSAFGTGESDKALVFMDAPTPSPCSPSSTRFRLTSHRVSSVYEDNVYEGYENPEDLRKAGIDKTVQNSAQSYNDNFSVYDLAKRADTLPTPAKNGVTKSESILREKPKFYLDEGPESTTENIYHDIPVMPKSRMSSKRISGSVPDLLAEIPQKDDQVPTLSRPRRNSTILDSYVMASDLHSPRTAEEPLNRRIPLSSDDSRRLSNMYMRMDGVVPLLSQTSYVAMDDMPSPCAMGSPNVFPVESVQSLIRSISKDLQSQRTSTVFTRELEVKPSKTPTLPLPPVPQSPVYMNLGEVNSKKKEEESSNENEDDLNIEIDMPIPVYESSAQLDKQKTNSYYNSNDLISTSSVLMTEEKFPCPTCHRQFVLPSGQVAALRDCSFASQMQKVVRTQKCGKRQCGHCENKFAQYRCLDCEQYLCTGCHQGHAWVKSNKGHKVMTLGELQSGKFQQEIKQLQVTGCDRPGCDSEARHFCGTCDMLMCADCLLRHSRTHLSCPIQEVASREQDFIQSVTRSLQTRKEIFNGALDNLSNYHSHCTESRDAVLDQLRSHQEYVYLVLDRCFDFIRSKVMNEFEAEVEKADILRTDARTTLVSMDHVTKFVKQLTEHGNPSSVVAMATMVKDEIARLQSAVPKVMESQLQISFQPGDVSIQRVQPLCGEVTMESVALATMDISRVRQGAEVMDHHTYQMALIKEFSTKVESDSKGCRPNGIAITANDLIVIVDDINKKLKAFDFNGNFHWEICPKGKHQLQDPWDVTVLSSGHLAVTDKGANNVKVFTTGGEFVTSFGDHLRKPWGITTNSRGDIIVTDTELRKVFIHDSGGRLLHTLPTRAASLSTSSISSDFQNTLTNFTLKCPEYVTANHTGDIIVSDFENHRIFTFDSLGRPMFKFGKKGKGMEEFHYPLGVATDSKGNIFVVNYQNQRITVITRNGQFLCCLTSKNSLQSLQTVAVSNDSHLVVVDGSKLKIYQLPETIFGDGSGTNQRLRLASGQVVLQREGVPLSESSESHRETTV